MTNIDPESTGGLSGDIKHCDQDLKFKGAQFRWEGKPQEGFSISTFELECPACLTKVEVTVKELS